MKCLTTHLGPGRPEGESGLWTPRGRLRSSPSGFPRGWTPSCCWSQPRGLRSTSTRDRYHCWPGRGGGEGQSEASLSDSLSGGILHFKPCADLGARKRP